MLTSFKTCARSPAGNPGQLCIPRRTTVIVLRFRRRPREALIVPGRYSLSRETSQIHRRPRQLRCNAVSVLTGWRPSVLTLPSFALVPNAVSPFLSLDNKIPEASVSPWQLWRFIHSRSGQQVVCVPCGPTEGRFWKVREVQVRRLQGFRFSASLVRDQEVGLLEIWEAHRLPFAVCLVEIPC